MDRRHRRGLVLGAALGVAVVLAIAATAWGVTRTSASGRFMLVYQDSIMLAGYPRVGTITEGMDVLARVVRDGTDDELAPGAGHPKTTVTIVSVTVTSA